MDLNSILNHDLDLKKFRCESCAKLFSRKSDLVRHNHIHTGTRPNVCGVCDKQFIQRSALTVHMRVHTGEKPHKCDLCNKPFSDSSSLARHRRVHTGYRPYACDYPGCERAFTRKTTLRNHQISHTSEGAKSESNTPEQLSPPPLEHAYGGYPSQSMVPLLQHKWVGTPGRKG